MRKDWLSEDLTKATLSNGHHYEFKTYDRGTIDEVIMKQNSAYAHAVVLPDLFSGRNADWVVYQRLILDAANNQIMVPEIPMGRPFIPKRINLTLNHFGSIVHKIPGKTLN